MSSLQVFSSQYLLPVIICVMFEYVRRASWKNFLDFHIIFIFLWLGNSHFITHFISLPLKSPNSNKPPLLCILNQYRLSITDLTTMKFRLNSFTQPPSAIKSQTWLESNGVIRFFGISNTGGKIGETVNFLFDSLSSTSDGFK